MFFLFLGCLCNFSIQSSISCNDTICHCNFFVEQREVFRFKGGVRAVIMPFGLVSAWNKRRRSKSQDQTDPCRFFSRCFFFFNGSHQILFFSVEHLLPLLLRGLQTCGALETRRSTNPTPEKTSWIISIHTQGDGRGDMLL